MNADLIAWSLIYHERRESRTADAEEGSMAYKHANLTEAVIGAFFTVYNDLGYGFVEEVYANALALELRERGVGVVREQPISVRYKGAIVGEYLADLVVEQVVIVETKAARMLLDEHETQLLHDLKATPYEVGLLLNFGPKPEVKRKAYDNARKGAMQRLGAPPPQHCG
jgi:GxxExxY protein